MNLEKEFPRSPYDMNAGLVMLPRTTDKAKASNEATLGEYHYNCPMDQKLLNFLGVNHEEFAEKVKELETDEKISEWVSSLVEGKEKDEFNNKMRHGKPEDEESKKWMEEQKKELGRDDYDSYFDNIDADEKRF